MFFRIEYQIPTGRNSCPRNYGTSEKKFGYKMSKFVFFCVIQIHGKSKDNGKVGQPCCAMPVVVCPPILPIGQCPTHYSLPFVLSKRMAKNAQATELTDPPPAQKLLPTDTTTFPSTHGSFRKIMVHNSQLRRKSDFCALNRYRESNSSTVLNEVGGVVVLKVGNGRRKFPHWHHPGQRLPFLTSCSTK